MAAADFAAAIAESRDALDQIAKGNPEPFKNLYSRADDVTLGNPFGGWGRGREEVVGLIELAASHYRDGCAVGFEELVHHVEPDWAYTVEVERFQAKPGGSSQLSDIALRVTCLYRREDDGWKLVHRHADPRAARVPLETVIQT